MSMISWFGNIFDQVEIDFRDSTWVVQEVVHTRIMEGFAEEKAILRCKQVGGNEKEAIIKVHMQIPVGYDLSPGKLAEQATTSVSILVRTELSFLKYLTEKGCTSTPRLLSCIQYQQTNDMCLPGGYIVFILMEELPGDMILDFWDYDREKRDRIRESFKSSWLEINNACVYHCDPGRRNLLWDESSEKCYILDFEDAEFIKNPHPWSSVEYRLWGLAKKNQDAVVMY